MTLFDSIILGIVEGITEFLPVSSTGHLMIANRLLGNTPTDFSKTFEIAIQSGAIFAVLFLYITLLFKHRNLILKIAVGFLPTLVAGLILYPLVKSFFQENIIVVFIALIVGGTAMLFVEKNSPQNTAPRTLESLSYRDALKLGTMQILALIPGISRSGATIIGGLALRYPRTFLVEFSFLLALPTIFGATAYDLYKNNFVFSRDEITLLLVGALVSAVVAYIAMKTFLNYIKNNTFTPFAYYRICIGIIGLLYFLL
ncbi:MAG: undecaprenyl-diphosphatase UppP [Candidatus Pacebacteria bacterium]|nr:undecaprenyl-diphosphatase UppP [Candidatus Paceibacterota bacterium]MBP9780542.1 undecaprenyl-diphosphatase UppP [Candidatus Paceibacterota bacterium]